MPLYIDDGYTATATVPARPGLHPEVSVQYRPALDRKRQEYAKVLQAADPAKADAWRTELIEAQVVSLNGDAVPRGRAGAIEPNVRTALVDLVLGYLPADEAADAKN